MPVSPNPPDLTIVIPAFNESASIGTVLEQIHKHCSHFVNEVIVVDDGSTDRTAEIAGACQARVIRHPRNLGYGASLKSGLRAARTEFVLTMDADGQHHSEDVARLWDLARDNDMVVGQRTRLIHSPVWRMPGKWLLWTVANYVARQHIPDLNSGLRVLRREVALRYLHLCPSGFSFSTTITLALFNRGYRVVFIPIQVEKRSGKSTVSVATGVDTLILILRIATLFDPLRVFIPISVLIGAVGVAWAIPYALSGRGLSVGSMLALVTAIVLFGIGLLCDQISQLRLERYE